MKNQTPLKNNQVNTWQTNGKLVAKVGLRYYSEIYQNFWIFAKLLGHCVKYQK